ncbi:MAG: SRPBCC domain-containing protein [Nitrospinae bacterium]|nr:SRPBCC domain-containing protein [Nitrospinota bacterium]
MEAITVQATVRADIEKVWRLWTQAGHIKNWYHASDGWHAPNAVNDLRRRGKFSITMAAKDGSAGFDFEGVYTAVEPFNSIEYTIAGGRKVSVTFSEKGGLTEVTETFEAETENPVEMQRAGWQAILDNFRKYVEGLKA